MGSFGSSNSNTNLVQASDAFVFDLNADMYTQVVHPMAVGDVFYARGSENPTTGYTWNVAADDAHTCGPEGAITYTEKYVRDANPNGYSGVGGTKTITFTINSSAISVKTCQIGLTQDQSWNLPQGWESTPQKSFTISIN